MGKPLRAVIVIDFEAETFEDASEFDKELKIQAKKLCENIVDPSNTSHDDICVFFF
jgi:hypothetical protein